jgi:arsenate reductase
MTVLTIYHNPRCSKSRSALKYLEENAGSYTVETVLYQKTGPTREQLEKLSNYLGLTSKPDSEAPWKILLRPDAKKLVNSWDETFELLEKDPNHLERPFIVDFENERAALGRPDLTDVEALVSSL